ncbi:transposase [Streptomyces vinaceus]|uniref:transposase n=1 Tax=Streptomyces vinaceus TaxID=1960 RepID=UPI0036CF70FE
MLAHCSPGRGACPGHICGHAPCPFGPRHPCRLIRSAGGRGWGGRDKVRATASSRITPTPGSAARSGDSLSGLPCGAGGKPYPEEFRQDVVRVARNRGPGETVEQVATDFGVHPMTLWKWMRRADVDDGAKPGTTRRAGAEVRQAAALPLARQAGWRRRPHRGVSRERAVRRSPRGPGVRLPVPGR